MDCTFFMCVLSTQPEITTQLIEKEGTYTLGMKCDYYTHYAFQYVIQNFIRTPPSQVLCFPYSLGYHRRGCVQFHRIVWNSVLGVPPTNEEGSHGEICHEAYAS